MVVTPKTIQSIPIFQTLNKEECAYIAAHSLERHVAKGEILIFEGEKGSGIYCVKRGLVKIYKLAPDGREQILRLATNGESFNEVPALDGGSNPASAAALEVSDIVVISQRYLDTMLQTRPEIALAVIRVLAGKLRHLVELVEDLSLKDVTGRVAKLLLDRTDHPAESQGHHFTQQEMAAIVGTAREVVGRALKKLESIGAITVRHGEIVIVNQAKLLAIVSGEEQTRPGINDS